MKKKNKYFSLTTEGRDAVISIYGDITSYPFLESDVSSYNLSVQLAELKDVDTIHVYINSYGGEVAEGLAIYNALQRHSAKIVTYVDGFACSTASVIFMAGDERVMYDSSLLMIHNPWTYTVGNANELRKTADDLEIMTKSIISAYSKYASISEDEIKSLLDAETWLNAESAISMGLASDLMDVVESTNVSAYARKCIHDKFIVGNIPVVAESDEKRLKNAIREVMKEFEKKPNSQKESEKSEKTEVINFLNAL